MESLWWQVEDDGRGRCGLCFRRCLLAPETWGACGVRAFSRGRGQSPLLGRFIALALDPIEKKPLYHWQPGTGILSLGSLGCTMACPFCQNHHLAKPQGQMKLTALEPKQLVEQALKLKSSSVAFTYNEPTLQAEYVLAAGPLLKEAKLGVVLVTNGLMAEEPLTQLSPYIGAANVDLKCFNAQTYAQMGGSLLNVQNTIKQMLEGGIHVELTTLVVPGISDDPLEFTALTRWVRSLSPEIPLHISRYFPAYKYQAPPTSVELMENFYKIAKESLKFVYLGNMPK